MGTRIRQALPWVVSAALVAYLVATTDLPRFWHAVRGVALLPFLAVTVISVLSAFFYETFCLTQAFRRFNAPVTVRELLPVKAASFLLNIVNYHAASGGIAVFLRKTRGVPLLEAASTFLFLCVTDVLALLLLVGAGLALAPAGLSVATREGLTIVLAVLGLASACGLLYWLVGWNFFVLGRLRGWRVFSTFRQARPADWFTFVGLRLGLVLIYTAEAWLFLALFDVPVPPGAMLALYPIVVLVWTIPVSIAGLGTAQVAIRALFGSFAAYLLLAPGAAVALPVVAPPLLWLGGAPTLPLTALQQGATLAAFGAVFDPAPVLDAFSTSMIVATVAVRVVLGSVCLRGTVRTYFRPPLATETST